jgi:hypothetical protein
LPERQTAFAATYVAAFFFALPGFATFGGAAGSGARSTMLSRPALKV